MLAAAAFTATALAATVLAAPSASAAPVAYDVAVRISSWGPRPAASATEARAHRLMARTFRDAGLRVAVQEFDVPGRGRSRNVIGTLDTSATCLRIAMAHTDSAPPAPGANDNASGLGVIAALASRLRAIEPGCDVWLVATGAEERVYTGSPDHLGALALARRARARGGPGPARVGAVARRGRPRPALLAALARDRGAPEGRGRAAARGAPRPRAGQLGARREHRQLRSPRVRAARPARPEAGRGRGRRALPAHRLRPPGAARSHIAATGPTPGGDGSERAAVSAGAGPQISPGNAPAATRAACAGASTATTPAARA